MWRNLKTYSRIISHFGAYPTAVSRNGAGNGTCRQAGLITQKYQNAPQEPPLGTSGEITAQPATLAITAHDPRLFGRRVTPQLQAA